MKIYRKLYFKFEKQFDNFGRDTITVSLMENEKYPFGDGEKYKVSYDNCSFSAKDINEIVEGIPTHFRIEVSDDDLRDIRMAVACEFECDRARKDSPEE